MDWAPTEVAPLAASTAAAAVEAKILRIRISEVARLAAYVVAVKRLFRWRWRWIKLIALG